MKREKYEEPIPLYFALLAPKVKVGAHIVTSSTGGIFQSGG
jgi:hypothetical protein